MSPREYRAVPSNRPGSWRDFGDGRTCGCVRRGARPRRRTAPARGSSHRARRETVGEGTAARTGQQFLAKAPDRFRGRLQAGPRGRPTPWSATARASCSSRRRARFARWLARRLWSRAMRTGDSRSVRRAGTAIGGDLLGTTSIASRSRPPRKRSASVRHGHDQGSTRSGQHTRLSVDLSARLTKYCAARGISELTVIEGVLSKHLHSTDDRRCCCDASIGSRLHGASPSRSRAAI
jgi:hypothetical protein